MHASLQQPHHSLFVLHQRLLVQGFGGLQGGLRGAVALHYVDDLSVADVSIATFFRNAAFARFTVDAARWPRTAGFVSRVLGIESFRKLKPFEERMIRTPMDRHRAVLAEMDAPLTADSMGTTAPRRGVMRI